MKQDIKKKIIDSTIKIIQEAKGKPEDITVREICREAGIGLSQINYHFQTKENLIAQCVQMLIGDVIKAYPGDDKAYPNMSSLETLKSRLLRILNFLYDNPNISRISILTDHQSPQPEDNTHQTITSLIPLVEKTCKEYKINTDPIALTNWMVLTMQGLFLRTLVIKKTFDIDLTSEGGRKKIIGEYIHSIFRPQ